MTSKFKIYIVRPVRGLIVYGIIMSFMVVGKLLPRKLVLWWHGWLADCFYNLSKHTRVTVGKNLETAFGQETVAGSYQKIGRKAHVAFAKAFTDYALMSHLKTRKQFERYFTIEGEEFLKAAYEQGKGVICLVPHTPGLEFSAIMPPIMGYRTMGVSSRIHNPALNRLMVGLREKRGMANIERNHCFQTLVDRLKKGECLIIMIDQDNDHIRGEFLNFFGKRAYTPIGCARLALATGAPVLPMFTIRHEEDDRYTFRILPEIPFERKETDLETFRHNTQNYNDALERIIREYPDQWVWGHRRWKTTPEYMRQYLIDKKIGEGHYSSYA